MTILILFQQSDYLPYTGLSTKTVRIAQHHLFPSTSGSMRVAARPQSDSALWIEEAHRDAHDASPWSPRRDLVEVTLPI